MTKLGSGFATLLLAAFSMGVASAAPQVFEGPGDGAKVTITLDPGGHASIAIDGGSQCGGGGQGSYVRHGVQLVITLPELTDEQGKTCQWSLSLDANGNLVPGRETAACVQMHGASCGEGDGPYAPVKAGALKGPSFDCAKATLPADRLVCADPGLAAADARLVAAYRAALKAAPSHAVAARIRRDQIAWSHEKMHCRTDSCLDALYSQRLRVLGVAP